MGKAGLGRARARARAQERRQSRLNEVARLRQVPYTQQQRWWCSETTAVVTGSNRGIGFEIVRQLSKHGLRVILTSRDVSKGQEAMTSLQREGFNVDFHQLDISDHDSITRFSEWIVQKYDGLDVLINNAGVNFNLGSDNSMEFAEEVIRTNYLGTKLMIEAMVPRMKPSPFGARIVNVSSRLGRLNGRRNRLGDAALRQQLSDDATLSEELINCTVSKFLEQVKQGSWVSGGWPQNFTDYSVSKLAVNAYTRLLAKRLLTRSDVQKVYINCYCPGWVKTAMTGWQGNNTLEEGADTGVWLALMSCPLPSGKFFAERREISF
ncbi:hypothetical protein AMTRI_Chr06g169960 [Amborella trichopoda]|uniref:Short-chain dehydrogenase/reductase n=1 Tax=Amborella trichopoda TaxID=13333 RepID=W1PGU9_AMBTC|nr:carbonyl reductase [NADPH] 1 [Amborella trichopoda]ERN06320.1 hypothetical protein AMTR_s00016p00233930 [Amborella trichopoda]|eukprot:XP_006844645.1 carbonyl reductase [NADPH] 1 [Amborella trichopoda]